MDQHHHLLNQNIYNQILMHREVHFGGNFKVMIDYYQKDGVGVQPEFTLDTIIELAKIELGGKQNLAPLLLSGPEAESIKEAKHYYQKLRKLYEEESSDNQSARLIADLILSEKEIPSEEIQAIVDKKHEMVPILMDILCSEELHNALYPGYGRAPELAAKCLGLIGDKRAIISLFENIGQENFFEETMILEALSQIGQPAKEFLLKVLQSHPINTDNERAAIALIAFKYDPEVSSTCLRMLQDPEIQNNLILCTYLILSCEGLSTIEEQEAFKSLIQHPKFRKSHVSDIKTIAKSFSKPG